MSDASTDVRQGDSEGRIPGDFRQAPDPMNLVDAALAQRLDDDSVAILHPKGRLTFRELGAEIPRYAAGLLSADLQPGDRVLILSHNSLDAALVFLSATYAGLVPAHANSMLRPAEIDYIWTHSEAKLVFADASAMRSVLASSIPADRILGDVDHDAGGLTTRDFAAGSSGRWEPHLVSKDSAGFMVYSSGTTGKPKGIVHAHRWIRTMGDPIAARNAYSGDEVVLATGEFSFVAALGSGLLHPLRAGCTVSLLAGRPTPENVAKRIVDDSVSVVYSVPTFYRMLLRDLATIGADALQTLQYVNSSGEALTAAVYEEWLERTGCPMYETYGVSELQMVTANAPGGEVKPGSVGKPLPGLGVELLDDDLQPVPAGQSGRLALPADDPGLALGYKGADEVWAASFHGEWFVTEDLFKRDEDGFLWHVGRVGDLFKSRGYLIAPGEIESVLEMSPLVEKAAVIGQEDDRYGRVIIAVVVPTADAAPSPQLEEQLREHTKTKLAPYKCPKQYVFRESLPLSAQGKLLRRSLEAELVDVG